MAGCLPEASGVVHWRTLAPPLEPRSTLIRNTDRGALDGNPTTGSHCECPGELRLHHGLDPSRVTLAAPVRLLLI